MATESIPDPTIVQYIFASFVLGAPAIPLIFMGIGDVMRAHAREVAERRAKAARSAAPLKKSSSFALLVP
jgi:hypothetical protein